MNGIDHYALLGVRSDAPAHEIRRAYRRLARQHHPDLNPHPDGPKRFAELAHAYAILTDPAQRARYDQTHHPPPTSPPNVARSSVPKRTLRRGVLELSPSEAQHLARHPLTLTGRYGRTIVLPAGAGHGDEIALLYHNHRVVLTIQVQRKT
jgi:curved DNA-binding protein CbpA